MPPKNPFQHFPTYSKNESQLLREKILFIDSKMKQSGLSPEDVRMTPDVIKQAWERADVMLKDRIKPSEFKSDPDFEKKVIEAERKTTEREKSFKMDREKMYAMIVEAIIFDEIRKKHWFGKDATTFLTSDFDDYENGADIAVELQGGLGVLPHGLLLSMDATYSEDPQRIKAKLSKSFQNLAAGKMGHIRFYKSADGRFKGSVDMVPVLVVGFNKVTINDLATLWINKHTRAELENHPAQRLILEECSVQLESFLQFLENNSKIPNKDLLKLSIETELKMVKKVLLEKEVIPLGKSKGDIVHSHITTTAKLLGSQTI